MRHDRGRALAAALAAVVVASRPASSTLVVIDGPDELRNLSFAAEPYSLEPSGRSPPAALAGPLVLRSAADIEYVPGSCPPRFARRDEALPPGAILLFDSPQLSLCSHTQHALMAARAGASAVLIYFAWKQPLRPVPGAQAKMWWVRDGAAALDARMPPIFDVDQPELGPLVDALRARARVRVRLSARPRASAWERLHSSAAWGAWQAVLALVALAVIELAALRLEAFIRADGGLHLGTIPHTLLLLELLTNTARAMLLAVDPEVSRGVLPVEVVCAVKMGTCGLQLVSGALFLAYFSRASASEGFAPQRLMGAPLRPRTPSSAGALAGTPAGRLGRVLVGCCCACGPWSTSAAVVGIAVLAITSVLFASDSMIIFVRLACLGADALVLALCARTAWQMRTMAATLPRPLAARLTRSMRHAILFRSAALLAGLPALTIAYFHPWARFATLGAHCAMVSCVSYVQCALFRPIGVVVLRGPLRRLVRAWQEGVAHVRSSPRRVGDDPSSDGIAVRHDVPLESSVGTRRRSMPATPLPGRRQRVQESLLLGVSLAMIGEFVEACGIGADASTLDAATKIQAMTASTGWSIAEQCQSAKTADGRPAVARATLFVSHAQRCGFAKLLAAIRAYLELHSLDASETFLWLDLFCIRQHEVEAAVPKIGEIERLVGRVVMVLDPWDAPVCLTRVWCLYECVQCTLQSIPFDLTIAPDDRGALQRALRRDLAAVQASLGSFDARTAQASVEDDRRMIFELIREAFAQRVDGLGPGADEFDAFNASVRHAVRTALAGFSWPDATPATRRLKGTVSAAPSPRKGRSPEQREHRFLPLSRAHSSTDLGSGALPRPALRRPRGVTSDVPSFDRSSPRDAGGSGEPEDGEQPTPGAGSGGLRSRSSAAPRASAGDNPAAVTARGVHPQTTMLNSRLSRRSRRSRPSADAHSALPADAPKAHSASWSPAARGTNHHWLRTSRLLARGASPKPPAWQRAASVQPVSVADALRAGTAQALGGPRRSRRALRNLNGLFSSSGSAQGAGEAEGGASPTPAQPTPAPPDAQEGGGAGARGGALPAQPGAAAGAPPAAPLTTGRDSSSFSPLFNRLVREPAAGGGAGAGAGVHSPSWLRPRGESRQESPMFARRRESGGVGAASAGVHSPSWLRPRRESRQESPMFARRRESGGVGASESGAIGASERSERLTELVMPLGSGGWSPKSARRREHATAGEAGEASSAHFSCFAGEPFDDQQHTPLAASLPPTPPDDGTSAESEPHPPFFASEAAAGASREAQLSRVSEASRCEASDT